MPGRKRSEIEKGGAGKVMTGAAAKPPVATSGSTGKVLKRVYCPCCGLAHGPRRLEYKETGYYSPPPTINHWERLKQRIGDGKDLPYGIIQEVGRGKGHGFTVLGHFGPEDDQTGSFPLLKERILLVLENWVAAGWIKAAEVRRVIK